MRKLLLLLLTINLITVSCAKEECTEEFVVQKTGKSFLTVESIISLSGMSGDLELNPSHATNFVITTRGDVNLNGHTLTLNNVQLNITGNLNGGGTLITQGNKGAYCLINGGRIQNNPNLSQATNECQSLGTGEATGVISVHLDCSYSVGDLVTIKGVEYIIIN